MKPYPLLLILLAGIDPAPDARPDSTVQRAASRAGGRGVSIATVTPYAAPTGGSEVVGNHSHPRQKAP
jgi:hypothetical protein